MGKESLEALDTAEYSVEYSIPKLTHRCLGNLVDILLFVLIFVGLYIGCNKIVVNTPHYKENEQIMEQYRHDCGLFAYSFDRKAWELLPTYYDNNNDVDYAIRVMNCKIGISNFHQYVLNTVNAGSEENLTIEDYNEIIKDFDDSRLAVTYKDVHLFVWNEEHTEIVANPVTVVDGQVLNSEIYYKNFYHLFYLQNCNGYLTTKFPGYYDSVKVLSNYLFYCELPISYVLSGILVYYIPGIFLKKGRLSLGKMLFKMGTVNEKCYSLSFGRYTARFAIFFFGELILSLFTFGIPIIISFTMMLCTKNKQGFPDYMLKCTEVDTSKANIYKDQYEASFDLMKTSKKAIDFKMTNRE